MNDVPASLPQLAAMLRESGMADPCGPDAGLEQALTRALSPLLGDPEAASGAAPVPSPALQVLLQGGRSTPATPADGAVTPLLLRGRRALAGALVLAVSGVGATGLSAAAGTLPGSWQRHVSDFSHAHLHVDLPRPHRLGGDLPLSATGAPAGSSAPVDPSSDDRALEDGGRRALDGAPGEAPDVVAAARLDPLPVRSAHAGRPAGSSGSGGSGGSGHRGATGSPGHPGTTGHPGHPGPTGHPGPAWDGSGAWGGGGRDQDGDTDPRGSRPTGSTSPTGHPQAAGRPSGASTGHSAGQSRGRTGDTSGGHAGDQDAGHPSDHPADPAADHPADHPAGQGTAPGHARQPQHRGDQPAQPGPGRASGPDASAGEPRGPGELGGGRQQGGTGADQRAGAEEPVVDLGLPPRVLPGLAG